MGIGARSIDAGNQANRRMLAHPRHLAVLALLGWLGLSLDWLSDRNRHAPIIEIDQLETRNAAFEIDVNQAEWPELALLPGIGETLARRIVAYRETEGPFRTLEDLDGIRGIGPKTIVRLRPHVLLSPGKTRSGTLARR